MSNIDFDYEICKNVKVYGLEDSIRRAKFPMSVDVNSTTTELTDGIKHLAQCKPCTGHDNWLCGIVVQFDLTLTNKAWVEMERYHFVDIISSQSTMHRIARFDLDKAYIKYVDSRIVEIMKEKVNDYNDLKSRYDKYNSELVSEDDVQEIRNKTYEELKTKYLELLYSNPAGFMLTAGITTNYRQLKTIYMQRKDHRLPEWRAFCRWIETLPHSELIIG